MKNTIIDILDLCENKEVEIIQCSCGAYTLSFSGVRETLQCGGDYLNDVLDILKEHGCSIVAIKEKYIHCNYCVNNWGLDLCDCGSGENYHECSGCNNCD